MKSGVETLAGLIHTAPYGRARRLRLDRPPMRVLATKALLDALFVAFAIVPVAGIALVVWVLNRSHNPGPLLYRQLRMGRGCRPFTVIKFRTMLPADELMRGFDDPLEVHRITPFGAWLRRTRIDELPQIVNIMRGEMSIVGPRPDAYHHAVEYCQRLPGYRERHQVRPGISGLAQTTVGYAEGLSATARKVAADLVYVENMSVTQELFVIRKTLSVITAGFLARSV